MKEMLIHQLPAARFHELPIEADPTTCLVIVAEDPDTHKIKGYWVAQLVVHTEPVWLDPELRSGTIGINMYAALLAAMSTFGIKEFYAFSDKEEIADYLQRLNLQLTPFITFRGIVPEIPSQENKECLQSESVQAY